MNIRFYMISLGIFSLLGSSALIADTDTVRFTGEESGRPPAFEVDGPWILDWSTHSDFPLLANFEMRLHDGASGEFIGTVTQLEGTGRGLKLFEDPGKYQLEIVASHVGWEIEISPVSKEQAEQMKRAKGQGASLSDASRKLLRRVPEGSFVEWRPLDDETLLLFNDDGFGWRVTFSPACPGLKSATALSFVTPLKDAKDEYDSILLDNGTRCYFDRVSIVTTE